VCAVSNYRVMSLRGANMISANPDREKELEEAAMHFGYLKGRWADESEYEDFAEYVKSMTAKLPARSSEIQMTKKPFRVTFTLDGVTYRMNATARAVNVETVKAT
jgi:hypothetical protein